LTVVNVDVLNTSAIKDDNVKVTVARNITVELPLSERYATGENKTALATAHTSAMLHAVNSPPPLCRNWVFPVLLSLFSRPLACL